MNYFSKVRTVSQSVKDDYESGKITIRETAIRLHKAGWTNYIDIDYTKRILNI